MNRIRPALAALLLAGCTFIDDPSKLKPGTTDSALSTCDAFVTAAIGNDNRCYGYDVTVDRAYSINLTTICQDSEKAWQAGRMTFDPAKAKACLDWLSTGPCNYVGYSPCYDPASYFWSFYAGKVQNGGACYTALDCASGTQCYYPDFACPGTCMQPAGNGEACGPNGAQVPFHPYCRANYYCDSGTNTCAPRAGYGASCTSVPCQDGYNCLTSGTCLPASGAGGSCDQTTNAYCAQGYSCSSASGPGTCLTPPASGPCLANYPYCASGSYYDSRGGTCTCHPIPAALPGLNGDCYYYGYCQDGLYCDYGTTYTCKAQARSGACSGNQQCAPGYTCQAGSCAAVKELGQVCSTGQSACRSGLFCDCGYSCPAGTAGHCAAPAGTGKLCGNVSVNEYASCDPATAYCDTGGGSSGTCAAQLAAGAACNLNTMPYEACGPYYSRHCRTTGTNTTGACGPACREP